MRKNPNNEIKNKNENNLHEIQERLNGSNVLDYNNT